MICPHCYSSLTDRHPGILEETLGRCGRCNISWKWVEGHSTQYSETSGCFPLCEKCWGELMPAERLPFYRDLWNSWRREFTRFGIEKDLTDWSLIETAVLEGK